MNIKVTVIGEALSPAAAPAAVAPVDAGFLPTRISPGPAAPLATRQLAPTAIGPTTIGSTSIPGSVPSTQLAPTGLPASLPPAPSQRLEPSSLPGVQHKPVEVSLADLARRFPGRSAELLQRVQAVLRGLHVPSMTSSSWLAYGHQEQEVLAELVRGRLKQNQESRARSVPQHLHRLNELLTQVLEAFQGGFMKRPPARVWAEHEKEVLQLEGLLSAADVDLSAQLTALEGLRRPAADCGARLAAAALAAEYLLDHVGDEFNCLMLGRLASLTASQAMHLEHATHLEQDIVNATELVALVQDGVLVKLPGVYTQLATVAAKPSDTQQFLAVESINDILQILNRKIQ